MKRLFKTHTDRNGVISSGLATMVMALCLLLAGCQQYDTLDYQQNFKPSPQPLNPLRQTSVNWYYQSTPVIPSPKVAGTAGEANQSTANGGQATTQPAGKQSPVRLLRGQKYKQCIV